MALTSDEQELYDFAKRSLPKHFFAESRAEEELHALVKTFDGARADIAALFVHTLVGTATGVWLNQHALDRGTDRQESEGDTDLRARILNVEDAITRGYIVDAAQAIIDNADPPVTGTVYMVELRQWRAFLGEHDTWGDTGGTFTDGPGTDEVIFTPDNDIDRPHTPYSGKPWWPVVYKLVVSGAASAGNDGTFTITGVDGDGLLATNASAVFEADPTLSWAIHKYDSLGNRIDGTANAKTFLNRGHRVSRAALSFALILPYGTSESTRLAVEEMLRLKKAAGVNHVIERRETAP